MKKNIYFITLLFFTLFSFTACEEKAEPRIFVEPKLTVPITCMKLNTLGSDEALVERLKKLYTFSDRCDLTLTLSTKKDIVCNSPQNPMDKAYGKFPRSYIKLDLRRGIELQYSYYVDLYSNVDEDDVEEGFERLKKDLIVSKGVE